VRRIALVSCLHLLLHSSTLYLTKISRLQKRCLII
jgi:hypothetical protein